MDSPNPKLYKNFLLVGHLEGISFLLLLCIAMPLKYIWCIPVAVKIAGSIHGLLFIAYCFFLYSVYEKLGWSFSKCLKAFLLGFLPTGTFFLNRLK